MSVYLDPWRLPWVLFTSAFSRARYALYLVSAEPVRQVGRRGRAGLGENLPAAPLDPELVPDGLGPEHDREAGEKRPLERVSPAQPVTGEGTVQLPVPEPQHAPK